MSFLALLACTASAVALTTGLDRAGTARASITTLTTAQSDAFTPYAAFAATAYCPSSVVSTWTCGSAGTNCQANPGFEVTAVGGDGSDTPMWYVGYDPTLDTIIVAHEGTNTDSIVSELEDGDVIRVSLSEDLFPGVSSSIGVHQGFYDEFTNAAAAVLSAVQTTLAAHPSAPVTIVGHSLGGAVATIDAAYLPLHLPATTVFRVVTFGLPRVGNQDWADYISAQYPASSTPPSSSSLNARSLVHINNKEDIVPILPGMFLGYHHPTGELHIQDSGAWDACPGMDNDSDLCTTGDVPNIFEGDESEHDGPYNGVTMNSGC